MLALLSIRRDQFLEMHKRAERGDPKAMDEIAAYWDPYPEIECFLCGNKNVPRPVFAQILPERESPDRLLSLPLCMACRSLNPQIRWARTTNALLRAMSCAAPYCCGLGGMT